MSLAEALRARVRQKRPRIVASADEWRELRAAVFKRQGYVCADCDRPCTDAHHVVSRGRGGDDSIQNLVGLCRADHMRRHGERVIEPYTPWARIAARKVK